MNWGIPHCWCIFFEFISGGGNGDNSSEFDDFVGAQKPNSTTTTPKPDEGSKTNGNQNGGNGNSHTNFFDDFDIVQTGNGSADNGQADPATQKQTMSKDSIMALFNQKPTGSAAQSADAISGGRQLPVNQKQFEFPANLNMVIFLYLLKGLNIVGPDTSTLVPFHVPNS